jgi:hypothetical protein
MKKIVGFVTLLFLLISYGNSAEPLKVDIYRDLADFGSIAYLKEGRCKQFSSYDRDGGNDDYYNFLRVEPDGTCVLAEMRGPGCISAIWMTGIDLQNGTIEIYLDGDLRVKCKLFEFFGFGDYEPFLPPLTGFSSGGYYCYIPMPYIKSCVVKVKDGGFPFYYHVTYLEFDKEVARTFTVPLSEPDRTYLSQIIDMWNNCGKDPKGYETELKIEKGNITIAPRSTSRILNIKGAGIIWRFLTNSHPDLWLKMYWDNELLPSVHSPFDAFFGVFNGNLYKSLPLGVTKDGCYCYFPMPFNSAVIEVENRGNEPVSISYTIEYEKKSALPPDIGRFHAKYEKQHPTVRGENYVILETTGRGHFVGCQLYMDWTKRFWYLEGDEMIYVDGEDFPSIYGTGTEDYFHAGWYFKNGTFDLPWHGCTVKDVEGFRTAAYRFHFSDYIPFTHSIDFTIEHGHDNLIGADYSSIAYWYSAYEDIDDEEQPQVKITKPEEGRIYILDKRIASSILGNTIIFGKITLKCDANDNIGIDGVGFFVDNILRYIDYRPPYEWVWDEKVFGRYNIKAIAYDRSRNSAEDKIDVVIFSFGR